MDREKLVDVKQLLKDQKPRDLALKSGVSKTAIESWKYNNRQPTLGNFEAILGAMGLEIQIVEIKNACKIEK